MPTWRGTLRSVNAAVNRAAREAERRERQQLAAMRAEVRQSEYRTAYEEAEEFRAQMEFLRSFHKESRHPIDWQAIYQAGKPREPQRDSYTAREDAARKAEAEYQPSWQDRLMRKEQQVRDTLAQAVEEAWEADEEAYREALEEYEGDLEVYEWAKHVLAGNYSLFADLVTSSITPNGFSYAIGDVRRDAIEMIADLAEEDDVIPQETKTLLKSGKLSVKKMPVTQRREAYQDYVCSFSLRMARELFALLPVSLVLLTARIPILNTSTGYKEPHAVLSVLVVRSTLEALNLAAIDPSDAMSNFVHTMDFGVRKGFASVQPLSLADYTDS